MIVKQHFHTSFLSVLSFLLLFITPDAVAQKDSINLQETEVSIPQETGMLSGTLSTSQQKPVATVLIIAGSGPTDRNGNSQLTKNNSLKYLSDHLTLEGAAVLRFDKRGIAGSQSAGRAEADMRFGDMVDDAVLWAKLLKEKHPGLPLIIVGHSEGSLIGMLTVNRVNADAFVSLCGPAVSADSILNEQLYSQSPELYAYCAPKLDSIKSGHTVHEKSPMLQAILRESVQPYLHSWMKYNPVKEIGKLDCPSLIIGGGNDLQVPMKHAELLANAANQSKLVTIENLNHILKKMDGNLMENRMSYNQPDLPIHEEVKAALSAFLSEIAAK